MTGYGRDPADPAEHASALRARLALRPDRPVPVLTRVLPSLGVTLRWADLATDDGLTIRRNYAYTTCLNARLRQDPARLRFTAAHEAGHIVLRHLEMEGEANNGRYSLCARREREANLFASALLMPADGLADSGPPWDKRALSRLRRRFGVSWEALLIRLDELGLQNRESSLSLFDTDVSNPAASD